MTFTILARDPTSGQFGIAVASQFVSVGAYVPFVAADVGIIATQARMNLTYGPRGLRLLRKGISPTLIVRKLIDNDNPYEQRQVGVLDSAGNTAFYTTSSCTSWAGGLAENNLLCIGNNLSGREVIDSMVFAYKHSSQLDFGARLISALEAAESVGGDTRGVRAAALVIEKKNSGYRGFNNRFRDVRVDDHDVPIKELARVYEIQNQRLLISGSWNRFGQLEE